MQHICRRAGYRQSYYAWFQAMHTRIDLLFVADRSEDDLNRVAAEAERVISEVEAVGNCFCADSELSRLNRCAPGETMLASDMLFDLLTTCKEYNRRTQGLFDVTVESERHDATTIEAISLGEGHTVTLPLRGRSMRPFLEDGRDKALLEAVKETPKVGDTVLAEIHPGHFVLADDYAMVSPLSQVF